MRLFNEKKKKFTHYFLLMVIRFFEINKPQMSPPPPPPPRRSLMASASRLGQCCSHNTQPMATNRQNLRRSLRRLNRVHQSDADHSNTMRGWPGQNLSRPLIAGQFVPIILWHAAGPWRSSTSGSGIGTVAFAGVPRRSLQRYTTIRSTRLIALRCFR